MKRKFAGIAAFGMALTLAFGMTVSAADSPTADKIQEAVVEKPNTVVYDEVKAQQVKEETTATVEDLTITDETGAAWVISNGTLTMKDADGTVAGTVEMKIETAPASSEVVEVVNLTIQEQGTLEDVKDKVKNSNEIKQAFAAELQKDTAKVKIDVLTPVSLEIDDVVKEAIEKAAELTGAGVPIAVKHPEVVDGEYYLIMHLTDDNGSYELLGPAQCVNGSVTVPFTSFSPVIPIKVELVGEDVPDEPTETEKPPVVTEKPVAADSHWKGGPDYVPETTSAPNAAVKSPQTNEVLPIVGCFMAVFCLAGAVVCVKKAHN